jgi:hypothetical protein
MIRDSLTIEQRSRVTHHYIDPGFVNRRLVETVLGEPGSRLISAEIASLPAMPSGLLEGRIDHVYTRVTLAFCQFSSVPTLREAIARGERTLFCSTEQIAPCHDIYDAARVTAEIVLDGDYDKSASIEFTASHVRSDTTRMELAQGGPQSIVSIVESASGTHLRCRPLIVGAPWLESEDEEWANRVVWYGREFFENFVEDFDEFADVRSHPRPTDFSVMERISEGAFKACLAEILGEKARKDWGGEQSDHFTSHMRLAGRRVSVAFLLKGPARFAPMALNHLGKNNDQIVRLANEPADVLVVQHCHEILPAVRATLRAFAVQPSRPRRYCLIDGRDSLRLLTAYGKVTRALALSGESHGPNGVMQ